ncbi:MAG: tripartite tricarboxylate transporter TctB family protein [Mesorhizobium sp.]|uniref:tripartite tricarboxylate transporter TctB family protein n=2 Tax=Mesorhizobium sp. TaxID=1871066 RepID=UPI000FE7E31E|nr:tripartite tricarboxylate transporter TctB family protein [Mesorhizobium sp.]RWK45389.1 MAG: tripartite tricarboxylate transporter TctB family protein [Mesorhizobium sp.]RWM13980.1 MAG: tripartite tricarboxylate transporter TctB family protein [Mesorhizobium sp.]TIQ13110.1 MAG: tripartite tricarboxylate transporter TctB family protein [Mesorhizobium sp.]
MTTHIDHAPSIADAENPGFEEEIEVTASATSGTILWGFALVALLLLPIATREGRRDLGMFQEPWFWPMTALGFGLIGGAMFPILLVRLSRDPGFGRRVLAAFEGMGKSLQYGAAFLVYLVAVNYLGFTISSILFMQALYLMSGLRGGRWPWVALAVTFAIVLAFRVGLDIWFPVPVFLQFFPASVGNFMGGYL